MFRALTFSILIATSTAFAQDVVSTRSNDKLDIKKLEAKYWSAKDDDFAVVQNRRYTKASRLYLTGGSGVPFNDPYTSGSIMNADIGYFFNERWGIEGTFASAKLADNDSVKQFVSTFGAIPDHNVFRASYFLSGSYVPFYAKMSFVDKSIIYFDMGVSIGLGSIKYDITQLEGDISKSTLGVRFGIFQQIFFSEHWALRADLINTWSNQERAKYYAPGTTLSNGSTTSTAARDLGNSTINDTSILFGFTYWH